MIYLDNAATTFPKPLDVQKAVQKSMRICGGAGRGGHEAAEAAAEVIYGCREEAAAFFNMSDPERVIFTHNCTHGLNMAIKGLAVPGKRAVVSGVEHNAVMRPLNKLVHENGLKLTVLPTPLFEPEMAVHLFEEAVNEDVCMVVCTHVSNVFGYILPIERIIGLCAERGVPVIIDAAQSAGCLPIDGDSGPIWCMPGHKGLYGPQGTGIMLLPKNCRMNTLLEGGTGGDSLAEEMPLFLPDRFEAGTQNAHGLAGLAKGISFVKNRKDFLSHGKSLIQQGIDRLAGTPHLKLYTSTHLFCQSGVLSFSIDGIDSETVASMLSERGIAVRGGMHCAPYAHKTADTMPGGTVRISVSAFTQPSDIRVCADAVREICKRSKNLTNSTSNK